MQFTLIEFNGPGFVTTRIKKSNDLLNLVFDTTHAPEVDWPELQPIHRADELWKHTCFELFIADTRERGYTELNFSPDGGWNCYAFDDYRQGMRASQQFEVTHLARTDPDRFTVEVSIHQPLALSLTMSPCAVLASESGELRYFASEHADKPDFHLRSHHVLVPGDEL